MSHNFVDDEIAIFSNDKMIDEWFVLGVDEIKHQTSVPNDQFERICIFVQSVKRKPERKPNI